MPGRISHSALPSKKIKARNKSKKRTLDALSIASHQVHEATNNKNRLGAPEDDQRRNKRYRDEDYEEDEDLEDGHAKRRKKRPANRRSGELDSNEGSDSEGNEWKLGQIDSDENDSDLNSDEAFGESDEERFDGFAFGGSGKTTKKHKAGYSDEEVTEVSYSELDEADLGEDAVDLATMLDISDSEDGKTNKFPTQNEKDSSSETDCNESESSSSEEDDEDCEYEDSEASEPAKIAVLQDIISNLSRLDESHSSAEKRIYGASEYDAPSDFGLTAKTKLTLEDLGLPSIHDPHIKKSLKILKSDGKKATSKLEVPLDKRQQDRLDRTAAYEKSKETLDRWTDTVKHNRRSEHLNFPIVDNGMASAKLNKELHPTNLSKPHNDLEATIQSILEESGLASANGKDDEDHIREFEELETKNMSLEEIQARRSQLRMARELLFREEVKAKRIKKIKSRSYRKVHRKQRENIARSEQQALNESGIIPSDDEIDAQDRRRAEERMGVKHRSTKWAKAMKGTGRTVWDENARTGIVEMAHRDEELRKRVEGKVIRKEPEDSDSSEDFGSESSGDDEPSYKQKLLQQLNGLTKSTPTNESHPGSKLAKMDFMRRADAARKKQNEAMVEEMKLQLAGESASEPDEGDIGRKVFGAGISTEMKTQNPVNASEFEEPLGSDDEENVEHAISNSTQRDSENSSKQVLRKGSEHQRISSTKAISDPNVGGGAWSRVNTKSAEISCTEVKKRRLKKVNATDVEDLDLSKAAVISKQSQPRNPHAKKNLLLENSDDDHDPEQQYLASSDQDLIKRAFAGADVVGEFEAEKKQAIKDEDDKIIDNTLPGWGSWVGDGVSSKELKRNKGRFTTISKGIKAQNRKDIKLKRVIINEKRVKKNGKYLASNLPHPFETREQYERSLRIPIGPEWTTKKTFQDATMPRILLKKGIIEPMSTPLL